MNEQFKLSFSELERLVFQMTMETFQQAMVQILSSLDLYLAQKRDLKRYELKEIKERSFVTLVGEITIGRRYYFDREEEKPVFLLDQMLALEPRKQVSPCLQELALIWATKGPSYRDARDRLKDFFLHQVLSHETIRQLLKRASGALKTKSQEAVTKSKAKVLFVEADGLWTGMQKKGKKTKGKRESFLVTIHEGWQKRQGQGNKQDYRLVNPTYVTALSGSKEEIWEEVNLRLLEKYEAPQKIQFVVNGDGASWIRSGTACFKNAIYQHDRFHLKREIRRKLSHLPQYIGPALEQIEQNNPEALFETLNKAAKEPQDLQKKLVLLSFTDSLKKSPEALIDYRLRLKERGIEVLPTWRGLGAAESSVDRFKLRTAKRGRAWSEQGLKAIFHMLGLLYENVLRKALRELDLGLAAKAESAEFIKTSAAQVARRAGRAALGIPQAGFPAINKGSSQGFSKLFRSIIEPSTI